MAYLALVKETGFFDEKRNLQNEYWFEQTINEGLKAIYKNDKKLEALYNVELSNVKLNSKTPYAAANALLVQIKK